MTFFAFWIKKHNKQNIVIDKYRRLSSVRETSVSFPVIVYLPVHYQWFVNKFKKQYIVRNQIGWN